MLEKELTNADKREINEKNYSNVIFFFYYSFKKTLKKWKQKTQQSSKKSQLNWAVLR